MPHMACHTGGWVRTLSNRTMLSAAPHNLRESECRLATVPRLAVGHALLLHKWMRRSNSGVATGDIQDATPQGGESNI